MYEVVQMVPCAEKCGKAASGPMCRGGRHGIEVRGVCQVSELRSLLQAGGKLLRDFPEGSDNGQICSLERSVWQSSKGSFEQRQDRGQRNVENSPGKR